MLHHATFITGTSLGALCFENHHWCGSERGIKAEEPRVDVT